MDIARLGHDDVSKRQPSKSPACLISTLARREPLDRDVGRAQALRECHPRRYILLAVLLQRRFGNSRSLGKPIATAELFDDQRETTGEGVSFRSSCCYVEVIPD